MKVKWIKLATRMAMVCKRGQMDLSTKDTGRMVKYMEGVDLSILMEIFKKANGVMTKRMGMEPTHTQMVPGTKATGGKTCSMGKARNLGLMEPPTRANTKTVKKTDKGSSHGQMDQAMMENFLITLFMVLVITNG